MPPKKVRGNGKEAKEIHSKNKGTGLYSDSPAVPNERRNLVP